MQSRHQVTLEQELEALKTLQGRLTLKAAQSSHSLSYFYHDYARDNMAAYVAMNMLRLARCFNVSDTLDEDQAADLAEDILEDHHDLKLWELELLVKEARKGYFGQVYNRLDAPTILDWLRRFLEKRYQMLEDDRSQTKARLDMQFDRTTNQDVELSHRIKQVSHTIHLGQNQAYCQAKQKASSTNKPR